LQAEQSCGINGRADRLSFPIGHKKGAKISFFACFGEGGSGKTDP
jgi:hypothetical protein